MSYEYIQPYFSLKEISDKKEFINEIGASNFLCLIFENISRTQIPYLLFESINEWESLELDDWKNILQRISQNEIALIYSFLPFVLEFLKIDLLPYFFSLDNISKEVRQNVIDKCYHKGKLKASLLRTYSPVLDSLTEIDKKLVVIQRRLLEQGAVELPETIEVKSPNRKRKKKITLGKLISELKKNTPEKFHNFFPDEIITKDQVINYVNSLDDTIKKLLLKENPSIKRNMLD